MIDFENPSFLKLRPVSDSKLARLVSPLLCPGEQIIQEFQSVRDGVIFTDRRVIAINIQGVTGMKKAYTILPYKRVQAFAIETAGIDAELQLWYSGLGTVRFELLAGSDLAALCQAIETGLEA